MKSCFAYVSIGAVLTRKKLSRPDIRSPGRRNGNEYISKKERKKVKRNIIQLYHSGRQHVALWAAWLVSMQWSSAESESTRYGDGEVFASLNIHCPCIRIMCIRGFLDL